jgi:hypothetical protein
MIERTNELLEELLATIKKSNKILLMVNVVNILTVLVLLYMVVK